MRFAFPRQVEDPWLCIADFFRPVDSGEPDCASFQVVTMGSAGLRGGGPAVRRRRVPASTSTCTASGWRWPRRWPSTGTAASARSWGFADEDGPTLTGLFRQKYRGGRYSWGYPACPDLEDNAKVVELLGADRIGVEVSEGFQLHPEQTTDRHHLPPPPGQVLRGLTGPAGRRPLRTAATPGAAAPDPATDAADRRRDATRAATVVPVAMHRGR